MSTTKGRAWKQRGSHRTAGRRGRGAGGAVCPESRPSDRAHPWQGQQPDRGAWEAHCLGRVVPGPDPRPTAMLGCSHLRVEGDSLNQSCQPCQAGRGLGQSWGAAGGCGEWHFGCPLQVRLCDQDGPGAWRPLGIIQGTRQRPRGEAGQRQVSWGERGPGNRNGGLCPIQVSCPCRLLNGSDSVTQ